MKLQQLNIQSQIFKIGPILTGERTTRTIRVTDEMGEETDGAGAPEAVGVWVGWKRV